MILSIGSQDINEKGATIAAPFISYCPDSFS